MALSLTLFALLFDTAAVAALGGLTWRVSRSLEKPSAKPFAALVATLTAAAALIALATLATLLSFDSVANTVEFIQIGAALLVPGLWLVYVLGYTGRGIGLTRRRIVMLVALVVPPALAFATLLAASVVLNVPSDLEPVVIAIVGPLAVFELLYLATICLYALYLLVGLSRRTNRVSFLQVAALLSGVSAPYVVPVLEFGIAPLDAVTVGYLLSAAILFACVRAYPVLTGFPKTDYVARTRVVEALQEAVVVLDYEDHILDANGTAGTLFGRERAALLGGSIHDATDGLDRIDLSAGATGTVSLRTTRGRREFRYSVSAVDDTGDDPVARTLLLRDVTDRQTRQQRLTVLNRVLRHNLSNRLDVVLAHADRIGDDRARETIRDTVTDLLELSETAREAETVVNAATDPPETVDLREVVDAVVADHRDRPGAISVDCPESLPVTTNRRVVAATVDELIDNAITHSDRSEPGVEVTARATADGTTEIAVADDGPGIPERERAVLDSGTETQLEHGLGMGLWSINWAVRQIGGDLTVEDREPRGTVATVRLYGTTN